MDKQNCLLLQDYLQGGLQQVKVGDAVSSWEFNRRGIPQGSLLGPLLFNVFLNDLYYFITRVKLNAYTDDQKLSSSDSGHVALYNKFNDELCIAVDWFKHNGLMAKPEKCQWMTLNNTDQDFSFVGDGIYFKKGNDIDLLGVNTDSKLTFDKHVSAVCSKVNKQLQVIKRFKSLVCRQTRQRLYNAFIQPVFQYCSDVWHHCSVRSKGKLEQLNKQALRVVLDDQSSTHEELLCKLHMTTLEQRRVQNMLVTVYKCLHSAAPSNLRAYLQVREAGPYFLRGYAKLKPPTVRTTTFGLHSFHYLAPNA